MSEEIPEDSEITPEFKLKTAKELQHSLEIITSNERTYVIAIARNHDIFKNFISRISCKKGMPIGGYLFDSQTDNYHVDCADYIHLGYVPVSFMARIKGSTWEMRVPMPENVLKKYLSSQQKKELKNFKNHFKSENYEIQFIQMIDPN